MQNAFLETNAICRFLDEKISGEEIRAILLSHGYLPVIGLHVIYELAKTFLSENNEATAKSLFEIVRDLKPEITEEPKIILQGEFNKFINGAEFDPFLVGARRAAARHEITKLSNGNFDDEAKNFIINRDNNFKKDHPLLGQKKINLFIDFPPDKKLRSFEEVVEYYKNDISKYIGEILRGLASPEQALSMTENLSNFPLLKSTVQANLFMDFIANVHKSIPNTDKVDDHRHIIEASYCDAFVTEDSQLLKNIGKINPNLKPIQWSTIGKIIEVPKIK